MLAPEWVQDAIFYQIFPDRFANGDPENDPANVQPWGDKPNRWNYQGGDLRGIIDRLDYLLDLGVNAIYLNPIFHSSANHRYHTIDYYKIDPFLGEIADFQDLVRLAHQKGIRIILDGVLNHCGRGLFAFTSLLETGRHSPYRDWFHVNRFPLNAYTAGDAKNYKAWWDIKELPKFNTANPDVRRYLFGMTRYWLEQGIDGWRLDVPNEVDDDEFWAEYRELVKTTNPDAYLVGEIWLLNARWVNETHFDALMNYPLRDALVDPLDSHLGDFALLPETQDKLAAFYAPDDLRAAYNTLGSHDTKRVMTKVGGDLASAKLAFAALFAHPGAPAIYYGDEIGISGGLDPACRAAFPWDELQWNHELRNWIQQLASLRRANIALRRGDFKRLHLSLRERTLVFERRIEEQTIWIALNYSEANSAWHSAIPGVGLAPNTALRDLLSGDLFTPEGNLFDIALPPLTARWLVPA
jgi:glycosidase